VAHDERWFTTPGASIETMHVTPANPAGLNPNKELARTRLGGWDISDFQVVILSQYKGFHGKCPYQKS